MKKEQSKEQQLTELKAAWLASPTFKLEETNGLEDYKEELLQFRLVNQEDEEIKTLQRSIIDGIKQQWKEDPILIPVDISGAFLFDLFTDELTAFVAELETEHKLQQAKSMFEDLRKTFEIQKEQMPGLSLDQQIEIVSHYYTEDNYTFIRNELPEMEGLEQFLTEMNEWAKAEFNRINGLKAAIKFKETVNATKPALIDKYACEAMHRILSTTPAKAENYQFIARVSFDIAEAMVNERIARGYEPQERG